MVHSLEGVTNNHLFTLSFSHYATPIVTDIFNTAYQDTVPQGDSLCLANCFVLKASTNVLQRDYGLNGLFRFRYPIVIL